MTNKLIKELAKKYNITEKRIYKILSKYCIVKGFIITTKREAKKLKKQNRKLNIQIKPLLEEIEKIKELEDKLNKGGKNE